MIWRFCERERERDSSVGCIPLKELRGLLLGFEGQSREVTAMSLWYFVVPGACVLVWNESAVVDANALSSARFLPPLLCSSAEALGEYGAVAFIRADINSWWSLAWVFAVDMALSPMRDRIFLALFVFLLPRVVSLANILLLQMCLLFCNEIWNCCPLHSGNVCLFICLCLFLCLYISSRACLSSSLIGLQHGELSHPFL